VHQHAHHRRHHQTKVNTSVPSDRRQDGIQPTISRNAALNINAAMRMPTTIITGEPGKVSGNIHDRQPVILPPESWQEWLTDEPDIATDLLQHMPEASLAYYPVTKAVGSPRNKGPEIVEPVEL
jgi:putative SOS response-associated peptidase YedK